MGKRLQIDPHWSERILANLQGMEYGSLTIIVHDGKIVQLERMERKRYELEAKKPGSRNQQEDHFHTES